MPIPASLAFLFRSIPVGKRYRIPVAAIIWFGVSLVAVLAKVLHAPMNNYFVYEGVFRHTVQQTNLYDSYPNEHADNNYYGPAFSLVIAPFAGFPWRLGCILWCMANAGFLYYAVMKLPFSYKQRMGILYISLVELLTSLQNVQFNPMLTAWILLAFVLINRDKEWAATLFIALGFMTKIYGIIALVTFLFSKNKLRFIGWFILWMAVLFCLPMLFSSPAFITQSYADWYHSVVNKNELNATSILSDGMQDISVAGIIRRVGALPNFSQLWVLVPAGILYLLPLTRFKAYGSQAFQMLYLALSLITVVIYSSSAESPTYIIAIAGVAIWFVLQPVPPPGWAIAALVFALVLTSLSPTDLFPRYVRVNYITRYSLKALPCFVVWLLVVAQLLQRPFTSSKNAGSPLYIP